MSEANESKKKSPVGEILRFLITGGVCFLIEFGVLLLLRDGLHWDTLTANPPAFLVSVVINYLLCRFWVFRGRDQGSPAAIIGFVITSLLGLIWNEGIMALCRALFGEDGILFTLMNMAVTQLMVNKVIAAAVVMVWNFFTKKALLESDLLKRISGSRS